MVDYSEYGFNPDEQALNIVNTGSGGRFLNELGEHSALVGHLHIVYKNKDKKVCEKDAPGASPAYGQQDFILLKTPTFSLVDNKFNLVEVEDIRVHIFKQYITLEADAQWQNKRVYGTFFIENVPDLDVVSNKDKKDFSVRLGLVRAYLGAPVSLNFKLNTKGDSTYADKIEISSHTVDKAKIDKRKEVIEHLYKQIDAKWEKYKEEKKKNAKNEDSGVVQNAPDPEMFSDDDLVSNF